jgi:FkbM family methyltransferase
MPRSSDDLGILPHLPRYQTGSTARRVAFDVFRRFPTLALRKVAKSGHCLLDLAFRQIGFKLVRVDRPTRTFDDFFTHVKALGFAPRTIVDVGAACGTSSLHRAFPDAKFILIEPLAEFLPALEQLATGYNCEIHFCAVAAQAGEAAFQVASDLYGSSIAHNGADATRQVPVTTLDDILDQSDFQPPILLKVDVQGHELQVMAGMTRNLPNCELIILETSTFRVGKNPPDFSTVVGYMKDHGFSVYDILDGILRPYDRALGQIDLVFVRDGGFFRRYQGWE